MGFRLGNFLAGMAEGAVEIEEAARKRNMNIIDTSLQFKYETRAKEKEARRAEQKELTQLAKLLRSYGVDDERKIATVLDFGPDQAKKFIADAATKVKKTGGTVGDYIPLLEGASPNVDVEQLINTGAFKGMTQYTEFDMPELGKSPIFQRDYSSAYEKQDKALASAIGVGDTENAQEMYEPAGTIDLLGVMAGADPIEGLKQSSAQVLSRAGNYFGSASGIDYTLDENTNLVRLGGENSRLELAIQSTQSDVMQEFNTLAVTNPEIFKQNPELIYKQALQNVMDSMPEEQIKSVFPNLLAQENATVAIGADDQASATTQAPDVPPAPTADNIDQVLSEIENNESYSPEVKKARKRAALIRSGVAKDFDEANRILSQQGGQ